MTRTIRRILFPILLAVCLTGCGLKNAPEVQDLFNLATRNRNHAEPARVHRRLQPIIEYYLNPEASDLTEVTVRETFDRWSEATHFEFVYKGRNRAGLRRDGKNTVSFLLKWPPELPIKHVAYCQNWFDQEGNIGESDIIFNMAVARFTTRRTRKPDSYYLEGLLSHEIGHMIGLSHIENIGSTHDTAENKSPASIRKVKKVESGTRAYDGLTGVAPPIYLMQPLLTIQDFAAFDGPDPQTIQAYRELYKAFLR